LGHGSDRVTETPRPAFDRSATVPADHAGGVSAAEPNGLERPSEVEQPPSGPPPPPERLADDRFSGPPPLEGEDGGAGPTVEPPAPGSEPSSNRGSTDDSVESEETPGLTPPSRRGGSGRFITDHIVELGYASLEQVELAIERGRGTGTPPEQVLLEASTITWPGRPPSGSGSTTSTCRSSTSTSGRST
jgi:hypothetical protein